MTALRFVKFVCDRESLRLRKELGITPWTYDSILEKYRFCNIRRRDDRVSQWIIKHVIAGNEGDVTLLAFLALCRFVNWPPTIQEILSARLWPSADRRMDWGAMGDVIDSRTKRGEKAWTGAFMVRGEQKSHGHPWAFWGKGRYIAKIVVERELTRSADRIYEAIETGTRGAVASVLSRQYAWGAFMAGQVVDDWTWTPALRDANDHYVWAPQGPGSIRGLNRVLGRGLGGKFSEVEWVEQLQELREATIFRLGGQYNDLTLMDIQNCLCEFDKYERVRLGEGRPRSSYRPETAY